MEKLYCKTPLVYSRKMSVQAGANVYLKMESMQPSGSFKNRGIGTLAKHYRDAGSRGIVSSSGGNAGLAAAYSGRLLGLSVTVVLPETTPGRMLKMIEAEGAKVIVHGKIWKEADALAREISERENLSYISPYDHPKIWEGNSSMVDEILEEGVVPDAMIAAVGGGGLFSGVAEGLFRAGKQDCVLIASETEGAPKMRRAIEEGGPVSLEKVETVATSLGASRVADRAFEWTEKMKVESVVVSESQAVAAACRFLEEEGILVEPSCGSALSVLYDSHLDLKRFNTVVVVICGGKCVSIKGLKEMAEKTGVFFDL